MKTFGICTESSHKKGMGHLFRMLNLAETIKSKNAQSVILVNNDAKSLSLLEERKASFETMKLGDLSSDWETAAINKYKIGTWINDRFDTDIQHSKNVKKNGISLVSFDDRGSGAGMADVNFGSLPNNFNYKLAGKKVFAGLEYLILNKEIERFKRERRGIKKMLVCLGGSDTYGVTVKVVRILKKRKISADIVTGPCFQHMEELKREAGGDYRIIQNPVSLIKEFFGYDLAVTGGGITPFEANASGLPCIIIANEEHEVANGIFLERFGSSLFAGYHKNIDERIFEKKLDIGVMSRKGLKVGTGGIDNVYNIINSL